MDKEMMKGSVDIFILSLISKKDMYGYEIAQQINVQSNKLYEIGEGTLYSALKRMQNKGFLESYWGDSETGGRRKYYTITDKGVKELAIKLENWEKVHSLIKMFTKRRSVDETF